jgi:hypothetical protein
LYNEARKIICLFVEELPVIFKNILFSTGADCAGKNKGRTKIFFETRFFFSKKFKLLKLIKYPHTQKTILEN